MIEISIFTIVIPAYAGMTLFLELAIKVGHTFSVQQKPSYFIHVIVTKPH